jgi:CRISPR-associated protein Cmr1
MTIRKPVPAGVDVAMLASRLSARIEGGRVQRYECQLVTPMYGGGVAAGEVDLAMPIRATAIRGQLRFWWRLLHGEGANSPSQTQAQSRAQFRDELAIFGGLREDGTLKASALKVRVTQLRLNEVAGKPAPTSPAGTYLLNKDGVYKSIPNFGDYPGYALFPAKGNATEHKTADLLSAGTCWRLQLDGAKLHDRQWTQVVRALRWWATFGGVGARTRRGCGAVMVKDAAGNMITVTDAEVVAAGMQLSIRPARSSAIEAWKDAVGCLKTFRQGEGTARTPRGSNSSPGRSYWPEPDTIRRITSVNHPKHPPKENAPQCFPRAAFGLPIIFEFKDRYRGDARGRPDRSKFDPDSTTLKAQLKGETKPRERMASPLILRPYPSADGMAWHPAVLRIDRQRLPSIQLVLEGPYRQLPETIDRADWQGGAWAADVTPMRSRGDDALSAFVAFFAEAADARAMTVPSQPTPTPESMTAQEERILAHVTYHDRDRTVTATHPDTSRRYTVSGDEGEALWASLYPQAQEAIRNTHCLATAVLLDGKLIRIEPRIEDTP